MLDRRKIEEEQEEQEQKEQKEQEEEEGEGEGEGEEETNRGTAEVRAGCYRSHSEKNILTELYQKALYVG